MAQAIPSPYITQLQLEAALAPIMAFLMQLRAPTMLLSPPQPTAMMAQQPL
jgi:hypothetical protein